MKFLTWYTVAPLLALTVACTGTLLDPGGTGSGTPGGNAGNAGSSGTSGGQGGGAGSTAGTGGTTEPGSVALHGSPIFTRFVRLTHEQWELSMRDLLELGATPGFAGTFTSDPPDGTFSNNERALYVTATLRGDYQRAVETLSEQVARSADARARITDGVTDSAAFIRTFGRKVYRRPLTTEEEARYQTLFARGAEVFASGDAFVDGLQLFLEGVFQSPHFLYRSELGTDGAPLSGFEVASKLSFLFRNTTPDDALLNAAQAGELDTSDGVVARATELLDRAESEAAFGRFHTELFGIDRYEVIDKDRTLFPAYDVALNADLRAADDRFLAQIFGRGQGLREVLTSTTGFVNQALAPFYGVSVPGSDFAEIDLGSARPGLFTRLGFLALNANLRSPDPIHRGVDLNHRVLCAELSPPPGTIPALPEPVPGQTNRERVDAHTGEGTCGASCHGSFINPVGFAFENFDAIGQLRDTDNGKPVDTTGEYRFTDGPKAFSGAPELMALMAESRQVHGCYSAHLAEFSLARDLAERDRALVDALVSTSLSPSSSIKRVVLGVVADPAFRTRIGAAP